MIRIAWNIYITVYSLQHFTPNCLCVIKSYVTKNFVCSTSSITFFTYKTWRESIVYYTLCFPIGVRILFVFLYKRYRSFFFIYRFMYVCVLVLAICHILFSIGIFNAKHLFRKPYRFHIKLEPTSLCIYA